MICLADDVSASRKRLHHWPQDWYEEQIRVGPEKAVDKLMTM